MKKSILLSLLSMMLIVKSFGQPAGWSYLQPYAVTENSGSLVTNYQLQLNINTAALVTAGQMLATGDDIRFGKDCQGNTLYNYWIESGMNTASTVIWVKIDTLYASATRTLFMFYGNASAGVASAVPGVFMGPMSSTDSVASGGAGGSTNSQRGFRFAPTSDLLVTAFGKREPNGTTRYVTLFNFSTQAVIAQTQVSGPAAQYSYGNLVNPIWITQGTQYVLELYQGASDGYYFGTSSQIGQDLTYYDMRYANGCTQNTFPTSTLSNYHYGYPDLWYWKKNTVTPAPTYVAIAGTGGPITLSSTGATSFCPGGSSNLNVTASGGSAGFTYSWAPAAGLSGTTTAAVTATPTVTTDYTCTVTDQCGSSMTTSVMITVYPLPTVVANTTSSTVCSGSSVTLSGSGAASYTWTGGVTDNVAFNPASGNSYTVTGTDVNGCMNTDAVTVNVNALPTVMANASATFACSGTQVTFTGSGTATSYSWAGGPTDAVPFTVSSSGYYVVTGTDANSCSDTASVYVTVAQSPIATTTASSTTSCDNQCDTLYSNATGGTTPYTYQWTPQNITTPYDFCVQASGCYTLTVTDANGCTSTSTVCITVNPAPTVVAATSSDSTCLGAGGVTGTASGASTYVWNPGNMPGNTLSLNPSSTTTYTITGTDVNGCANTSTTTVTVLPLPNVTYTSSTDTVCSTDPVFSLAGGSPMGGTYSGTGVSANMFTPSLAGNGAHTVTYMYADQFGCSSTATHIIVVDPCTGVVEQVAANGVSVYPNPFSDMITINRNSESLLNIYIYDATGRLVMTNSASGKTIEVNTGSFANGMYSMMLIDGSSSTSFRIIKQ